MDGLVKGVTNMKSNKINTEIKDYTCGDCINCDGGMDCFNSSVKHLPERRQKALCPKCQCAYCTKGECPASRANKPEKPIPAGTMAIFILENVMTPDGQYIPCIAVEGEAGYHQTDWTWGKDLKIAEKIADGRNAKMGLSKWDAMRIQMHTMRELS
jgi:hypothetical protein